MPQLPHLYLLHKSIPTILTHTYKALPYSSAFAILPVPVTVNPDFPFCFYTHSQHCIHSRHNILPPPPHKSISQHQKCGYLDLYYYDPKCIIPLPPKSQAHISVYIFLEHKFPNPNPHPKSLFLTYTISNEPISFNFMEHNELAPPRIGILRNKILLSINKSLFVQTNYTKIKMRWKMYCFALVHTVQYYVQALYCLRKISFKQLICLFWIYFI